MTAGCGFDRGGVSSSRSGTGQSAVGALIVVNGPKVIELFLEYFHRLGAGLGGEPFFEGLVESFNFSLGLGVAGGSVFLGDSQRGEQVFELVFPAAEAGGVDQSVIGRVEAGGPYSLITRVNWVTTMGPVTGWWAVHPSR